MRYKGVVIRPPSEAGSYILQVTYGCSHNACTFCPTYKGIPFSYRDLDEILEDIRAAARIIPGTRRVFLADGNALCLPTERLLFILTALKEAFPRLERVGIYANGSDILGKDEAELKALREAGLGIIYLGLESGDDEILRKVRKKDSSEEMIEAVRRAARCGCLTSVIVLLGLGGRENWESHAVKSARAVSRMQPDFLSALTLMVVPGTPLYREQAEGKFALPSQRGLLEELRVFIRDCRLEKCIFRTNHASNYLPLRGTLSEDKEALLECIDYALEHPETLRPEGARGL
jgi:radical SAM superfamily enzyme YgiQ (UPF0313 family)